MHGHKNIKFSKLLTLRKSVSGQQSSVYHVLYALKLHFAFTVLKMIRN